MNDPCSTIKLQRESYSTSVPVHQCTRSGVNNLNISSTHCSSAALWVGGSCSARVNRFSKDVKASDKNLGVLTPKTCAKYSLMRCVSLIQSSFSTSIIE